MNRSIQFTKFETLGIIETEPTVYEGEKGNKIVEVGCIITDTVSVFVHPFRYVNCGFIRQGITVGQDVPKRMKDILFTKGAVTSRTGSVPLAPERLTCSPSCAWVTKHKHLIILITNHIK